MDGPNLSDPFNREFLEGQYRLWRTDRRAVDESLHYLFSGAEFYGGGTPDFGGGHRESNGYHAPLTALPVEARLQTAAVRLINAFRMSGHLIARTNPLEAGPRPTPWELDFDRFAITDDDRSKQVDASMFFSIAGAETIGDVLDALRETYCGSIGVEYMHIQDLKARTWLAQRIEPNHNRPDLPAEKRLRALHLLRRAEQFENFLQVKFLGKKRFGLEGGETLIPMMDAIIRTGGQLGVLEFVIGMPHRGRLNVLTNILMKPFDELFIEFLDPYHPDAVETDGDVKYHMGYSSNVDAGDGKTVHLTLTPNPSHLEAVNPVVNGRVRAKQRLHKDEDRSRGVPLLLHGDAAFAGQGVVAESLGMANLQGYRTGGTLHIVVNNQIGFTTRPRDARSTEYCTDIAKFIQAPIFHVNAEDPDACIRVAELAMQYRQAFKSDAVIDLVCYRKMGHNETDDASVTQPVEHRKIQEKYREQNTIVPIYARRLVAEGLTTDAELAQVDHLFKGAANAEGKAEYEKADGELEAALKTAKDAEQKDEKSHHLIHGMASLGGRWKGMTHEYSHAPCATGVPGEVLDTIAEQLVNLPADFTLHKNLQDKIWDEAKKEFRYPSGDSPYKRRDEIKARGRVDWGAAEAMAFGSLVLEEHPVRLSGQDSRRATFSFRHAYYYDANDGRPFCPLANFPFPTAPFDVFDSFLSEMAVVGFEYGYTLDDPQTLVLWEAQFGDFANGAQVIIDQFVVSGESKWNRGSGLVMLLPHGYEGQGPEHSSARLERYLQLCAEDNIQVAHLTSPAQYFHALRRQVKRNFRKPLILMTPKANARSSTSPVEELISGRFHEVLADAPKDDAAITRVILCTGKVYHDLNKARTEGHAEKPAGKQVEKIPLGNLDHVAIVRIEQLYPWPAEQLKAALNRFPKAEHVWAQEESHNNGAWSFVEPRLRDLGFPARYVGRDPSASPAIGSEKLHKFEQCDLIQRAFLSQAHGTDAEFV